MLLINENFFCNYCTIFKLKINFCQNTKLLIIKKYSETNIKFFNIEIKIKSNKLIMQY